MSVSVNVSQIANQVSTWDEKIAQVLPFILPAANFIPGVGPGVAAAAPLILEILNMVDNAAKAVSAGDPAAALKTVLAEINNHLTPGAANAEALSPTAPPLNP
jgi:hypothetical protein